MHIARTTTGLWGMVMTLMVAGGCHVPPPVVMVASAPGPVRVNGPPPRPLLEVPPAQPDPSYMWQEGYWHWVDGEYDWVQGQWIPGYQGYEFVPATYVVIDGFWTYRPPFWRHHRWHGGYPGPRDGPRHRSTPGHAGQPSSGSAAVPRTVRAAAPEAETGAAHTVRAEAPDADTAAPRAPSPASSTDGEHHVRAEAPAADDATALEARVDPERETSLRQHPQFRGETDGRMVFGNTEPRADEPRPGDDGPVMLGNTDRRREGPIYATDETGAIVLTNGTGRVRYRPAQPTDPHVEAGVERRPFDPRVTPHRVQPPPPAAHPVPRSRVNLG